MTCIYYTDLYHTRLLHLTTTLSQHCHTTPCQYQNITPSQYHYIIYYNILSYTYIQYIYNTYNTITIMILLQSISSRNFVSLLESYHKRIGARYYNYDSYFLILYYIIYYYSSSIHITASTYHIR